MALPSTRQRLSSHSTESTRSSSVRGCLSSLDYKAEAVDPLTVRFTLSQPLGDFVAALASGWGGYIVSPTAIKAHEVAGDSAHAWLLTHDAGSGPYQIAQADTAAKQVTLQRVGDYWGGWSDGPHVESAILRWGLDSATARLLLERGDADVAIGLAPSDFSQVQKDSGIVASSYQASIRSTSTSTTQQRHSRPKGSPGHAVLV